MKKRKNFMDKMQPLIFGSSKHLMNNPDAIKGKDSAPEMGFEIIAREMDNPREMFNKRRKMFSIGTMFSLIREIRKTSKSMRNNPLKPKNQTDKRFIARLERYAKSINVKIGYAKLKREFIFKNHAVLFDNAIVLSMEMDKEKIDMAPHLETGKMVLDTYNELGIRANKITNFIRKEGFAAEAAHPIGGPIGYVPLALEAGMGWVGKHGVLITPDYGPRHRLAAVLTNIINLPYQEKNPHEWIGDYCSTCGRCIETCPGKAIFNEPISKEDGRKTHIDIDKCFPKFSDDYGCSVCIKECMFNRVGYAKLKEDFDKKKK